MVKQGEVRGECGRSLYICANQSSGFYDGNAEVYLGDLSFLGIFPGRDDGPGDVHDFRCGGRHGKRGTDRWGEHHDSGEKGDRDGNGYPGEI